MDKLNSEILKNNIIESFDKQSNESNIYQEQKKALELFKMKEFPTKKDEYWKYTSVKFLNSYDFSMSKNNDISKEDIASFKLNFDANVLVFINGIYNKDLSTILEDQAGIDISNLAEAVNRKDKDLEKYYAKYADNDKNIFTAMNTATAEDGAFIKVAKNKQCKLPIHIMSVSVSKDYHTVSNQRNVVVVAENAEVSIVETNHTVGQNASFQNNVAEMIMLDGAKADYYKIQDDAKESYLISTLQVHQESNTVFNSANISLNGTFIRNNVDTYLADKGCEANMDGFYFANGNSFIDNHTLVDHAHPLCNSNEYYKGIMDGKSTAVFNGRILVRKDAQQTNAYQTNNNILLSDDAKINTKPELEIYADDVKCSHGATSGYLDKESLFYLRTRGLDEDQAKSLLLQAFAGEVIERIHIEELRNLLLEKIQDRLKF